MSIKGIGAKLIFFSGLYAVVAEGLTLLYPEIFEIRIMPYKYLVGIGFLLLLIGIPFLIISVYQLVVAFTGENLVTTGMYAMVRNPIYSAWILFLIPGIALLFQSWALLGASLVTYVSFRYFIIEEEEYLEEKFGQRYLEYKKEVNQIFPSYKMNCKS